MKKNIRLTENDIRKIVKNSLQRILNEDVDESIGDRFKGMYQGFKQGANSMNSANRKATDYDQLHYGKQGEVERYGQNRRDYDNVNLAKRNIWNAMSCLHQVKKEWVRNYFMQLSKIYDDLKRINRY